MTKKFKIVITENDDEVHKVTYNIDSLDDAMKLLVYDMQEENLI